MSLGGYYKDFQREQKLRLEIHSLYLWVNSMVQSIVDTIFGRKAGTVQSFY